MTRKFKSQRAMIFFPSPPDLWITSSNSSDTRVALIKISFRLETFNRIQSPPNTDEAGRRRRRRRRRKKKKEKSVFVQQFPTRPFHLEFYLYRGTNERVKGGKNIFLYHFCVLVGTEERGAQRRGKSALQLHDFSIAPGSR